MRNSIKLILLICLAGALAGVSFAQKMTIKEIRQNKAQIVKYQKEINRLQAKLKKTKDLRTRNITIATIDLYKDRIKKIKDKLYKKPQPAAVASPEVMPIVIPPETEEAVARAGQEPAAKKPALFEMGAAIGVFAGGNANLIAEARAPLRLVLGPARLGIRAAVGYVQDPVTSRKFVPVIADLLFNFPPGWFTGTNNYIGFGLNYTALTTGRVAGTVGGELFYGVESEGFGGTVFGEVGYAILRTGFSPSRRGLTVMIGYRTGLGF